MADHQPLRGLSAALIKIEGVPDRHHQGEQQQRKGDAQHRQNAAALVSKRVLGDEPGQRHECTPGRTGNWELEVGTSQPTKNSRSRSLATTVSDSFLAPIKTLDSRECPPSQPSSLYCREV